MDPAPDPFTGAPRRDPSPALSLASLLGLVEAEGAPWTAEPPERRGDPRERRSGPRSARAVLNESVRHLSFAVDRGSFVARARRARVIREARRLTSRLERARSTTPPPRPPR